MIRAADGRRINHLAPKAPSGKELANMRFAPSKLIEHQHITVSCLLEYSILHGGTHT